MKNIVILGSSGKLGLALVDYLKSKNKIFTDKSINIEKIMSIDFLKENNINCIINCVGSTKERDYFFHSNFLFTSYLSEKLKEFDLKLKRRFTFIHFSTIGVNAPFMKYNFRGIVANPLKKEKIKYNPYELSKTCGEYNLKNNLIKAENINTLVIQPSSIIFKNSSFLRKLKFFILFFPFKLDKSLSIPITPINFLLNYISQILNTKLNQTLTIKKIYKREKINSLFKKYLFLNFLKIRLPDKILKKIITSLPDNFIFTSLKRILIFIFIL